MERALKPLPPALPETTSQLLEDRVNKSARTLNDLVEEIYLKLFEDKVFKGFLYAVYDEQAVEGSLACDNVKAAEMIREKAIKDDNEEVSRQKLATIVKTLNVVLRRYKKGRKERRNMIGGEVMPDGNGGD